MAIISAEFTFALISDAAIAASRGLFRHNEWRLLGRRRFASFRIMSRDFGDFDPELVCLGDCQPLHRFRADLGHVVDRRIAVTETRQIGANDRVGAAADLMAGYADLNRCPAAACSPACRSGPCNCLSAARPSIFCLDALFRLVPWKSGLFRAP